MSDHTALIVVGAVGVGAWLLMRSGAADAAAGPFYGGIAVPDFTPPAGVPDANPWGGEFQSPMSSDLWGAVADATPAPGAGERATTADGEGGSAGALDAVLGTGYRLAAAVSGGNMQTSAAGVAAIKQREGVRLNPYKDSAGYWTVGVGHKLRPWESVAPITADQADAYLLADLAEAEATLNTAVNVPLTQSQFDALVSFVFNVGVGAFRSSTMLKKLNAGDFQGAAGQFGRWVYVTQNGQRVQSAGLANRRASEAQQFAQMQDSRGYA